MRNYTSFLVIISAPECQFEEPEDIARRYSIKKVFLEILQNSQENTCARASFLKKLQT